MITLPRIELHAQEPDGKTYILNRLEEDNAKISGGLLDNPQMHLEALKFKALNMACRWQQYLPNDKVQVVEVSHKHLNF